MKKQTILFLIGLVLLLLIVFWATYNPGTSDDPNDPNYVAPKGTREGGYNTNQS